MTIKTILVPIRGDGDGNGALDHAFLVARRFDSHIEVVHARPSADRMMPSERLALTDSMYSTILAAAERSAVEDERRVRTLFDTYCAKRGIAVVAHPPAPEGVVSAAWREENGFEAQVAVRRSLLADLVVIERAGTDEIGLATLEEVLLDSRRPLLVSPPQARRTLGNTIAIGWNGSPEAAAAVVAARPFLERAKKVVVLTAPNGANPKLSADELVENLAWHGVKASTHSFRGRSVGKALLAAARDAGADLLVIGDYSHSRGRELFFGGVTLHVLQSADIPVLMQH